MLQLYKISQALLILESPYGEVKTQNLQYLFKLLDNKGERFSASKIVNSNKKSDSDYHSFVYLDNGAQYLAFHPASDSSTNDKWKKILINAGPHLKSNGAEEF